MADKGRLLLEQNIKLDNGIVLNIRTYRLNHINTSYGTVIYPSGEKRRLTPVDGNDGYYAWIDNRIYSWKGTELSTKVFNLAVGKKTKITGEKAIALEETIEEQHKKGVNTSVTFSCIKDLGKGKKLVFDSSLTSMTHSMDRVYWIDENGVAKDLGIVLYYEYGRRNSKCNQNVKHDDDNIYFYNRYGDAVELIRAFDISTGELVTDPLRKGNLKIYENKLKEFLGLRLSAESMWKNRAIETIRVLGDNEVLPEVTFMMQHSWDGRMTCKERLYTLVPVDVVRSMEHVTIQSEDMIVEYTAPKYKVTCKKGESICECCDRNLYWGMLDEISNEICLNEMSKRFSEKYGTITKQEICELPYKYDIDHASLSVILGLEHPDCNLEDIMKYGCHDMDTLEFLGDVYDSPSYYLSLLESQKGDIPEDVYARSLNAAIFLIENSDEEIEPETRDKVIKKLYNIRLS